jgi:uncharacterized SAM-binding protein YcdF (DUF218 family)
MPHAASITWNFWRIAALLLFVLCLLWGVLPLATIRIHAGCAAMIGVGALGIALCVFLPQATALWRRLWGTGGGKAVLIALVSVISALLALFIGVSVVMAIATCRTPPDNATVVVLGAGLREDRPSRILRERLDAAAEYLNAHPDAKCVLSGGQGADEPCTEASAMKTYLLEKGIAEDRLYLEEQSTSTYENLQFSRQVIQENGLCESIAVVTQGFHQCRAQAFARKQGFTRVGAVTARTQWELFPSYWVRDFAGLCHMVLLGT